MPCYQAGNTVDRAIQSIRNQTHQDWELIIIDDGSRDDSASKAAIHASADSRVSLHRRDHQGVVEASNHGFRMARGQIIARMDADDVSRPSRLQLQLDHLLRRPEIGAVSSLARFAGNPDTAGGYAYHVNWANQCLSREQIAHNRFIDLPVPHPTLMYRRELIESYGGYKHGDFPEDYELILRWISHGTQIAKLNEILYDWHDPPTRLSRTDSRYDMLAFHRCKAPFLAEAIHQSGCSGRELWIAGAGKLARKSAATLEQAWKPCSGYIDIDPKKIGRVLHGRPIVSLDQLPPKENSVIVSYVGSRGAREIIQRQLSATGRKEGYDFWLAA